VFIIRFTATIKSTMKLSNRRMAAGDDFSGLYVFAV